VSLDDLEKLVDGAAEATSSIRPIVVVVDDDASIRDSLKAVLKDRYEIRTCKSAVEGIRTIGEDVDCVILDVKMPVNDGFWLAQQLRIRDPDIPIIFHSAYQNIKDPYEVINEFRPFGFIVKGDNLTALLTLVDNAVRHAQRTREGRRTLFRLREAREQMQGVHRRLSRVDTKEREGDEALPGPPKKK
jgi:DNA-binding NtrC family response regulator